MLSVTQPREVGGACRNDVWAPQRCFLGVNATLKDFLNIGDDVFIGMDASVVKNAKDGEVILGESSASLDADDRRAKAVKKSYFKL